MRFREVLLGAGLAGAVVALSGPAVAETAFLSSWLPPTHKFTEVLHLRWADDVRAATDGEIDFEVFSGSSLLPATGTLQGVAAGVAQNGIIGGAYYPSELPIAILLNDLGFTHPDAFVLPAAFADFSMNHPAGYGEWRENGVIFGAGGATPVSYYLCGSVVESLADLDGKRVRTFGGGWAKFAESIGMIPVNLPMSETFIAMSQGSVDCVMTDLSQLTSGASLLELTKSVVLLPLSPGFNMALHAYNPEFWRSVSPENKRKMWDQAALGMARTQIELEAESQEALEAARAAGVTIVDPTDEMTAAYDAWLPSVVESAVAAARSGLKPDTDPQELATTFQGYIDKWAGLLDGIDRTNPDAVAAVLGRELFDKLDAATYGME